MNPPLPLQIKALRRSYQHFVRPLLFCQDPEEIHERTLRWLAQAEQFGSLPLLERVFSTSSRFEKLQTHCLGLDFPNPVGVAAGLDKNAKVYNSLLAFGFGFVECGTVTPRPQPGNDRPRLFRLLKEQALINRLGFNNDGQEVLAHRLRKRPLRGVVGVNLGKNKVTPNERAPEDYRMLVQALWKVADYLVINVSSPNTPHLRELQEKESLQRLLDVVFQTAEGLQLQQQRTVPILLKIAPDLTDEALQDLLGVVREFPLSGLIATNTTLRRERLTSSQAQESGGLSGPPLRALSTQILSTLYRELNGQLPLIGVGGVRDGKSAYEKIRAGASLVQLYTGLVYQGPTVALQICQELEELLGRDGFSHLKEAVGSDHRS